MIEALLKEIGEELIDQSPQVLHFVKLFVQSLAKGDNRSARVAAAEAIMLAGQAAVRAEIKRQAEESKKK